MSNRGTKRLKTHYETRLYFVGTNEDFTEDIRACDAKSAVRQYCEGLPWSFWDNTDTLEVCTRTHSLGPRGLVQEAPSWWHVDASRPPAWIIERVR
jgi:hypothetical protein